MYKRCVVGLAAAVVAVAGCAGTESGDVVADGVGSDAMASTTYDDACKGQPDILEVTRIRLDVGTITTYDEFLASMSRGALKAAQGIGGPGQTIPLNSEQEESLLASLQASVEKNNGDTDFSNPRNTDVGAYDLIWHGQMDTKRSVNNRAGDNERFCVAG